MPRLPFLSLVLTTIAVAVEANRRANDHFLGIRGGGGGDGLAGAIAGGVIGALIAIISVVISILIICIMWFRRRARQLLSKKTSQEIDSIPMENCEAYGKVTTCSSPHDIESEYEVIDDDPYELVT